MQLYIDNNGQLNEENSSPKSIKIVSKYVTKDSCVPVWTSVREGMEKKEDMHLKKPLKIILLNGTMKKYIRLYGTTQFKPARLIFFTFY